MSDTEKPTSTFAGLGLGPSALDALKDVGYEIPSPIQAESIPALLQGNDLLGQAQTGTGKTAAFALPLLQRIDPNQHHPQLLILAPTRELALQVAEACEKYARYMSGIRTLAIYGGQAYDTQLRALRKGVQVVIGTPGRVMDHVRRGTLVLDKLQALVLDEADEMLRMGFIDDVEWIMQHTPPTRQIALFSATMPNEVRRIADNYLKNPTLVKIASKTATASTIRQRLWEVRGLSKLAALTRLLEQKEHDAALIFVRTKTMTEELTEQLRVEGFPAAALHGDIPQAQREKIVEKLKRGQLDVVVATDVVARGLDVERISHVFNFDIPYDAESYIHRIGRTGRAGRSGDAILFVTPRERHLLRQIERTTSSQIEKLVLPTAKEINETRSLRLKKQLVDLTGTEATNPYHDLISELVAESGITASAIAAAALALANSDRKFFLNENEPDPNAAPAKRDFDRERSPRGERGERGDRKGGKPSRGRESSDADKQRYWINVGHDHGVKPGNIVGAIANEASINSGLIGRVDISEGFTTVDLPKDLTKKQLDQLAKARVCGRTLDIRRWNDESPAPRKRKPRDDEGGANKSGAPKSRAPRDGAAPAKRTFRKTKDA